MKIGVKYSVAGETSIEIGGAASSLWGGGACAPGSVWGRLQLPSGGVAATALEGEQCIKK